MRNPFKRKPNVYDAERERLLIAAEMHDPTSNEYATLMNRIDQLDKIRNRTSELKKTIIPAAGTVAGVAGIYGLQQFAGIIVPKALESLAARQEAKKHPKELD